jgi:hypothetical protein
MMSLHADAEVTLTVSTFDRIRIGGPSDNQSDSDTVTRATRTPDIEHTSTVNDALAQTVAHQKKEPNVGLNKIRNVLLHPPDDTRMRLNFLDQKDTFQL